MSLPSTLRSDPSRPPLARARVLVVGLGGLGCPASLALASAGVGALTLLDPDRVDPSNLHRQPWHRPADVGRLKVESAAEGLARAVPGLAVTTRAEALDAGNAEALLRAHDAVVDGTDAPAVKFLLSDAAVRTGVPLAYGGVLRWQGQALRVEPGGPCLRCAYEDEPGAEALPTCAQAGVLGPMAGWVGALQARLLVEWLEGRAEAPRLHVLDGRTLSTRAVRVPRVPGCPGCAGERPLALAQEAACRR